MLLLSPNTVLHGLWSKFRTFNGVKVIHGLVPNFFNSLGLHFILEYAPRTSQTHLFAIPFCLVYAIFFSLEWASPWPQWCNILLVL